MRFFSRTIIPGRGIPQPQGRAATCATELRAASLKGFYRLGLFVKSFSKNHAYRLGQLALSLCLVTATLGVYEGAASATSTRIHGSTQLRVVDVRLMRLDRASSVLKRAGFKVIDYDALPEDSRTALDKKNWLVVVQKPQAGRQIRKGATIDLGRLKAREVSSFLQDYDEGINSDFSNGLPYPGKKNLVALAVAFCERLDAVTALRDSDFTKIARALAKSRLQTGLPTATVTQREIVASVAGSSAAGKFCSYKYRSVAPSSSEVAEQFAEHLSPTTSTSLAWPVAENAKKASEALAILDQFQGTTWRSQIVGVEVDGPTGGVVTIRTTLKSNEQARALEIIKPAGGDLLNTTDARRLGFQYVVVTTESNDPLAEWFLGDPKPQVIG